MSRAIKFNEKALKTTKRGWIFWLAIFAVRGFLAAQPPVANGAGPWRLELQIDDAPPGLVQEFLREDATYPDSLAVRLALRDLVAGLRGEAFLEASVDTLRCAGGFCRAALHAGPRYEWVQLSPGNLTPSLLDRAGYRPRRFENRPFSYAELREVQEELLTFLENHGYPFARVWVDSTRLEGDRVSASLMVDRDALVLLDTLEVRGDMRISRSFLQHYLGLIPGRPYDRERILRSRDRLRELVFLRPTGEPELEFREDRATLVLPLEKRPASRFDFLIGVLPRSPTTGGMLITGSFEGEFVNAFGAGERLYAQFEQLRPQTQELNLAFEYPYLLGLPLGVDIAFDLFRNDTTFLNLELDLGVNYMFAGGNYLKAFWNHYRSSLLSLDEDALVDDPRLPDVLDLRNTTLGLELFLQDLDYRLNPRRGWQVRMRAGAGSKRILPNSQIEDLGLGYLYDSLDTRSLQVRLEPDLSWFLPLFRRSTLKLQVRGGFLVSPQAIYRNEQFRLGGNRMLRGFDEESLLATHFGLGTAEYRLLIDQNAYLYAFLDAALLYNKTPEVNEKRNPLGFGAGISFETSVGLFGVSLAFGKAGAEDNFDFGRPKIHFGYLSMF